MRTLKEIDEQILADSKETVQRLNESEDGPLIIPESDALWLQTEARFGEKYREMYGILQILDEYLKMASTDGRIERQPLRQKLKEMLEKL